MTILIAPDKYKGSLDTFALCDAMEKGVHQAAPTVKVIKTPLADGGDGFAKVLAHYLHTKTITIPTFNAAGKPIHASYEWDPASKTAIIELASASGLALLDKNEQRPLQTSTYGTGCMVKHALDKGAQTILLGLGGSATNDGGTGLLSALGYRLLDAQGRELNACGATLSSIAQIEPPEKPVTASFTIACDVNNPLLGETGATLTYAPQKGATPEEITELEKGMKHFASILEKHTGKSIASLEGAGAAGGTAAGLMLLPHTRLKKGTDIVLQHSKFFHHLSGANLVFTGEGGFDAQTLQGKVVFAVAQACKKQGIPCVGICGKVDADEAIIRASGLEKVISISSESEDSFSRAAELVMARVKECTEAFYQDHALHT